MRIKEREIPFLPLKQIMDRNNTSPSVSPAGPTPDWIVGVSALELCLANCSWVGHKTLNLYPYDAGTDSGVTYEVSNNPSPLNLLVPLSVCVCMCLCLCM